MVFAVCGVVAGAIGFAIFDSGRDADPMDAMALAPPEALIAPMLVAPATRSGQGMVNRPSVRKTDEESANATRKVGSIKPACRESPGEARQGDCPVRVVRLRPPRAVNERPLIAAVPIGHRDDPTMLPASAQTGIRAGPLPTDPPDEPKAAPAPTQASVADEIPSDAAPAAEAAPSVSVSTVKKPRPRAHHASSRRNQYSYRSAPSRYGASRAYAQAGYARLW
jgi:hypothetical protein